MFSKKINLSLLLLTLAAAAQAQKTKVQGDIKGLTGPVIFNYSAGTVKKADTLNVKNGKFSWEATLLEPQKVIIGFPKEKVTFYADKGEIRITGKADFLQQLNISGSPLQKEADAYFASIKDLSDQEAAISQQIKEASKDEQKVLHEKRERLRLQKKEKSIQYIRSHPKSYFSVTLIADLALSAKYQEVKSLYDLLHPAMQQTSTGKMLSGSLPELKEKNAYDAAIKELTAQEIATYQQYYKVSKDEQKVLGEKLERLQVQKKEKLTQYIKAHPKSDYSVRLILEMAGGSGEEYPDIKPLYDLLDPAMLQTEFGKRLSERLIVLKRSAPGEPMLNFTLNSDSDRPVQFADFRGKYVFVDFWASWCAPCRAENPNVLAAYNRYKDKNFTVIGVSLDDKEDKWKKAIQEDKLPWTQVSDLKGWGNPISTYYGITGIPYTLLVGPDGKIIAKGLRGKALHKKLAELLDK